MADDTDDTNSDDGWYIPDENENIVDYDWMSYRYRTTVPEWFGNWPWYWGDRDS